MTDIEAERAELLSDKAWAFGVVLQRNRDENARLRAENERLRAVLADLEAELESKAGEHWAGMTDAQRDEAIRKASE